MFTFVQIWHGPITGRVLESERSIRSVMLPEDKYVRIETPAIEQAVAWSDHNRIALARAISNMVYVDADYCLLYRPKISQCVFPCFIPHTTDGSEGCVSLFAVNGCCYFFDRLTEEYGNENMPELSRYCRTLNNGSFCFELFDKNIYRQI